MKKLTMLACLFAAVTSYAAIPQSITIESGNVRVRLDGKKRWNINKIEWKNRLFGIDEGGAHYGTAFQPQGSKFFIGSGHDESGVGEKFISLKIIVDGNEITPVEKNVIKGKKVRVEKISEITTLKVKSTFTIENDVLLETTELTAATPVKINFLYFFMHPWSTRFNKFHTIKMDGSKLDITFKSDNSFPNRDFVPAAAWYDTKSGLGVVSVIRNIKGQKKPMRFLWDRTSYRKDYLCDYAHSTFPAGNIVIYECKTRFFQQLDPKKWIADAEKLFQ